MPKLHIGPRTLHYLQMGRGPGVVMIHGLGTNQACWQLKVAPRLVAEFQVITYDLPGHGYSTLLPEAEALLGDTPPEEEPPELPSLWDLAGDIVALLDHLGVEKAHVVGHCIGGDIALHFAHRYPDRTDRIVLVEGMLPYLNPDHYSDPEWTGWDQWEQEVLRRTGVPIPAEQRGNLPYNLRRMADFPAQFGPGKGGSQDRDAIIQIAEQFGRLEALGVDVNLASAVHAMGSRALGLEDLRDIPHPTLLLYATDSAFEGTLDVLRAQLPNATVARLAESELQHLAPLIQPAIVAEHIQAFCRA